MAQLTIICEQLARRLTPVTQATEPAAGLRQAAVALVLREHAGWAEVLMIKRAPNPRDFWSGHLALPGGRQQPEDADLCATALRETREEVGVDLREGGRVLGELDQIRPSSPRVPPVVVTPYVTLAPPAYHSAEISQEGQELIPNHEVAAAFWVPVDFLKKSGRSDTVRHIVEGHQYEWPAYPSVHGPIWGLTERILTQFLALIDP